MPAVTVSIRKDQFKIISTASNDHKMKDKFSLGNELRLFVKYKKQIY